MKQITNIRQKLLLSILALALLLASCGQPAATPTTAPTQEPTGEGGVITGEAMVESIEILLLESFPIQVLVVAQGNLPDSCTEISEITKEQDGNTFRVTITTTRPADAMCAEMLVPFEERISLDVVGLPAGVYTVNVNGVSDTFEFAVDNAMVENMSPHLRKRPAPSTCPPARRSSAASSSCRRITTTPPAPPSAWPSAFSKTRAMITNPTR